MTSAKTIGTALHSIYATYPCITTRQNGSPAICTTLRESQKRGFLNGGGDPEWIKGNVEADKLADAGAKLQAPPLHLVLRGDTDKW